MKTIIEMAREAGAVTTSQFTDVGVELFAALVRADEREACAKVCETHGVHPAVNVWNGGPEWYRHGKDCAEAIRARGNA